MSYLSWRKEHEEKYIKMFENDMIDQIPAFRTTSRNPITDKIIEPVVEQLVYEHDMDPITFSTVFAQYLYETYNILPIDVELFTQFIITSTMKSLTEVAADSAIRALDEFTGNNIEEDDL